MSVLLVDDVAIMRKRLKESLSAVRSDLEIYEASSGEEALRLFNSAFMEIVILDISLPDISGIEVLKEIKKAAPKTLVIIFTSYPTPEYKERCIALGANYFFNKCIDYRKIIDLFRDRRPLSDNIKRE